MRRELAEEFARRVALGGEFGRDVIDDLMRRGAIASRKQAHATLAKWERRGWWDWGTTLEGGWFTPEAPERLWGGGTAVVPPAGAATFAATFAEAMVRAVARCRGGA